MTTLCRICRVFVLFLALSALMGIVSSYAMDVLVYLPSTQTVTVPCTPESTVSNVKEFVFNVTEVHPINQRMFKGSEELENTRTLASYKIADRDTLVVKYGTGGAPAQSGKSGGIIKIVLFVVILAGVILGIRKMLSK